MKMIGGTLQEAVDSFDRTRQDDVNYLRDFIETTLAPSLAATHSRNRQRRVHKMGCCSGLLSN